MHVKQLLHNILGKSIHAKRIQVLSEVVQAAISSKRIGVSAVGSRIKNKATVRSNIRKVDRLYSNPHFKKDRFIIGRQVATFLIPRSHPCPTIIVDGSKLPRSDYYMLRASIAVEGRSLGIYEAIHTQKVQGSQKLYKRFLKHLKRILPEYCCPTLVTDAEFRASWFEAVGALDWHYVGRVRGNKNCAIEGNAYQTSRCLFKQATYKERYLGSGILNKQKRVSGEFYLYRSKSKGRHAYTRSGRHSETEKSRKHAKAAKEPWLLFSSLKQPAKVIIALYRLRMTIEENFRDHKSHRFGLGLDSVICKKPSRYNVILIVANFVSLILYLIGCAGEQRELQRQFQSNSTRKRRVLSRVFLGHELLYHRFRFSLHEIKQALKLAIEEVALI